MILIVLYIKQPYAVLSYLLFSYSSKYNIQIIVVIQNNNSINNNSNNNNNDERINSHTYLCQSNCM